jgi:hypothetical protein
LLFQASDWAVAFGAGDDGVSDFGDCWAIKNPGQAGPGECLRSNSIRVRVFPAGDFVVRAGCRVFHSPLGVAG